MVRIGESQACFLTPPKGSEGVRPARQDVSCHACSRVVKVLTLLKKEKHSHGSILCVSSGVTLARDVTRHWKACHPELDLSYSSVVTFECSVCPTHLLVSGRSYGGLTSKSGGEARRWRALDSSLARMTSQRGCLLCVSPPVGCGEEGRAREHVSTC